MIFNLPDLSNTEGTALTAAVSAVVAILGTVMTYMGRNKDSSDRRLDLIFTANQALVDDLRSERAELLTRVVALEGARDGMVREMDQMRMQLSDQGMDLRVLRQREAELRVWAAEIMAWSIHAVSIVRDLGGTIHDPPEPPHNLSPHPSEEFGFRSHHVDQAVKRTAE